MSTYLLLGVRRNSGYPNPDPVWIGSQSNWVRVSGLTGSALGTRLERV
ncbi:hypothetical protein BVRB_8g192090 [Beta vulgaris subsp. vulgaris]|nr:hypothetical protein BVRB_8g192090 [Beta vulgaris subsp. vulgaris]